METRRALRSSSFPLFPSRSVATVAVVLASTALSALAGCGGSNGAGTFQNPIDDGGSFGTQIDGSLLPTDAGVSLFTDAVAASCSPASVASFTPTWKPPLAFKSGACADLQISNFFDACLGPSSTPAGCTAFTQANASCAACLQSDDTDPKYGPVIWHASRTYYTTNIAGCVANEQGDAGGDSCGAAYQGTVQCKETACAACATVPNPACEEQAGSGGCQSYIQTLTAACGTVLDDPSSPVAICIPPSTDTAQSAYLQLAPVFCGQ